MIARVCRIAAIAIALAGVADPSITLESWSKPRATIVIVDAPTLNVMGTPTVRGERAWRAARDVERLSSRDFRPSVRRHAVGAQAAACPDHGVCILIFDGALPARLSSGAAIVGGVRVDAAETPRLAIAHVDEPPTVPLERQGRLRVRVSAVGATGESRIQVVDDGAIVGEGLHRWGDGEEGMATATVDVPWVPLKAGLRRLRIVVGPLPGEVTLADNEVEIGALVEGDPGDVLVYELQPSWHGTFVRRALEADPRLLVHRHTSVAPSAAVSRGVGRTLSADLLSSMRVVVVPSPERLGAREATLLEQFVRMRGGSLVLLWDGPARGAAARLSPPGAEHHDAVPREVGPLRVSHRVSFQLAQGDAAILESGDDVLIASRVLGRGRVIASGAIDAWRYRGDDDGFGHFWSDLVAEAATVAGARLDVRLGRRLASPTVRTPVDVEWRSMNAPDREQSARATLHCGARAEMVRLWPGARPGTFSGLVDAPHAGECVVEAAIDGSLDVGRARLLVAESRIQVPVDGRAAEAALAAHGGIEVPVGSEAALVTRARTTVAPARAPVTTHPMRSPWVAVPFAACLGLEWWIRRRRGLR